MRSVKQAARILGRQPAPPVRLRQAVVDDINADRTVDITLAGAALTNVPCLTGAVPRVGSAVMVVVSGRDMFVLGSVADDSALGYTPQVQHGTFTISLTTASTAFDTINFPWEWASAPDVVAVANRPGTKAYVVTVGSITTTTFICRVTSFDGSSNTEDVVVRWAAFGAGE